MSIRFALTRGYGHVAPLVLGLLTGLGCSQNLL